MNADATSAEQNNELFGMRHWLYQVVPPLLMLGILFTTTRGAALIFLAGIFVFPVFISIISIIAKLIFYRKQKYFLVRPLLTIAMYILIIILTNWTYQIALTQTVQEAELIHHQCNKNLTCPEIPTGWKLKGSRVIRNDFGYWVKYTSSYYHDKGSFNIRVYQGRDLGNKISGGINLPLTVARDIDG